MFPKVAPGLLSAPSEDVNKIRMEVFGSIGFPSSFSLLICADLHVLSSTAGSRWDLQVCLTGIEKYLGQDCQRWNLGKKKKKGEGGGLHRKRKVDMKCCIVFILYKVVFFLNNVFYHELKCSDSCSHLSDGKTKCLLKNFNHEYAVWRPF